MQQHCICLMLKLKGIATDLCFFSETHKYSYSPIRYALMRCNVWQNSRIVVVTKLPTPSRLHYSWPECSSAHFIGFLSILLDSPGVQFSQHWSNIYQGIKPVSPVAWFIDSDWGLHLLFRQVVRKSLQERMLYWTIPLRLAPSSGQIDKVYISYWVVGKNQKVTFYILW